VPTSDPNILLAALGSNVVEVNVSQKKTGRIVAFVSTDDNAEGTRFNDGKATPQGVFIVGRMNRAWRDGQPGKLFAMDLRVPGNSFGLMTILGPTEVCDRIMSSVSALDCNLAGNNPVQFAFTISFAWFWRVLWCRLSQLPRNIRLPACCDGDVETCMYLVQHVHSARRLS